MDSFGKGAERALFVFACILIFYGFFNLADFVGSTTGRLHNLEERTKDMYKLEIQHDEMWIQYKLDKDRKFIEKRSK